MQKRSLARWLLLIAALVGAGMVMALRTESAGDALCDTLRREVPKRLDLEVGISKCRIDPLSQTVRLSGVSVFEPGREEPVVAAEEAEVSLRNVFPGSVTLDWVKLTQPRVTLSLDAPAPAAPGTKAACPLHLLERLKVQHLEIQGGELKLAVKGRGEAQIEGLDVEWRLKKGVLSGRVELKGGTVTLQEQRARLGKSLLEAELDVDDEVLSIQRAELSVEGMRLSLSGTLEALCEADPRLALNAQVFVPVETAARLGGLQVPAGGTLWSRLAISGRPQALAVKAELQGSEITLGPAKPGDFTARLAWSGKDLTIEDFFTKAGAGTVRVSGSLRLESGLPAKLKVETVDASLARVLERAGLPGAWVDLPASAKVALTGNVLPRPNLQGDAEVKTGRFLLASRAFDAPQSQGTDILTFAQGAATLHLAILPERVEMTQIKASVGPQLSTRLSGEVILNYDMQKGIEVHALADPLVLSDFGHIAGLPWSGVGSGRADIVGPYHSVDISGQMAMRDFTFANYALGVVQSPLSFWHDALTFEAISGQKGKTQYFGDVTLLFKRGQDLYARASVQIPKGRTEDLADVIAGLHPTLESFQNGVLTGAVSGTARIDSPVKKLQGTIQLQLEDTRYWGRQLGAGPAVLRFDQGKALVLDALELEGALGTTHARGRWEFVGPLAFNANIEGGALAELMGTTVNITGPFAAEAVVKGDTDVPIIDGQLTSAGVRYANNPVGSARLEAHLVGKDLKVTGAPFADARGELMMRTKAPFPWEAKLKVDVDDLKAWLPVAVVRQGMGGGLEGTLTGSGDLDSLDVLQARAELDHVTISRGDFAVASQGPVVLQWAKRQLKIEPARVKGTNTELAVEGTWGPVIADVKMHGAVDLRLIESLTTSLERTSGQLELTAAVAGSVKEPALVGSAEVRDARFAVRDQAVTVRSLNGHMEFSKSRVLLQGFEGFMNEGRVSARGDVRLDGVDLKQLEVGVDLEQVVLQARPDLPATLTGSLLMFGKPGAYQLAGAVDVVKLRYSQNLELDALLKNVRNSSVLIAEEQKPVEWLRFDVDMTMGPDVRIDNNLARAQMIGKLKLSGTNLRPIFVGTLEAGEGSQATFRGNVLSIGRGVLVFNGLVPTFDLNAQAQVREYLVSIKAFGRLDDPKVSLTAQPPLAESEVLTLLTLGITSKESVGDRGSAYLAGEVLFSASGLDAHLQRFLSKSVGLKDQRVQLSTSFNPATGQAEPSVSWESTVLSDNLKVGITQPVTGFKGTKARAEYKFNDKVSARAQWDNQTQESTVGNPGVDLKFRFEWE